MTAAEAPLPLKYVPATHSWHVSPAMAAVAVEYRPGEHRVQFDTLEACNAVEYVPAAHAVHDVDELVPVHLLYVPTSQRPRLGVSKARPKVA